MVMLDTILQLIHVFVMIDSILTVICQLLSKQKFWHARNEIPRGTIVLNEFSWSVSMNF